MGLYRPKTPDELRGATVLLDEPMRPIRKLSDVIVSADDPRLANKPKPAANKSKPGRPVKVTGDPAKDKRNARQAELMRKRRASK